jgi:hypothetical protein
MKRPQLRLQKIDLLGLQTGLELALGGLGAVILLRWVIG